MHARAAASTRHARAHLAARTHHLAAVGLALALAIGPTLLAAERTGAGVDSPPQLVFANEFAGPAEPVDHLVLIYDEWIDPTSIPAPNDFAVTVNGIPVTPTALELVYQGFASDVLGTPGGFSFLKLSLPAAVTTADNLTLAYSPGTNPIRDLALNPADPVTNVNANILDVNDLVPGDMAFFVALVDRDHGANRIWLFFNHPIDPTSIPAPGDFAVTVNSSPVTPTAVGLFRPDINIGMLDVVLPSGLSRTDDVTLAYAPGANPIRARASGIAADPIGPVQVVLVLPPSTASGTVAAGGSVGTIESAPTPADPVGSAVTTPTGGTISITESATLDPDPVGYAFFGQQVLITAPAASDPSNPLQIDFQLDASIVPVGQTAASVQIFRNGVVVPGCATAGIASPSPCVDARELLSGGDLHFRVLTLAASRWNVGIVPPYAFSGFRAPVDSEPTVNKAKAGSAIPVKFSLGGNRGTGIFAAGSPRSQGVTCNNLAPTDLIESTVTAGSSSLSYDPRTDTYTYAWKTASAWAGSCRRLVLSFADGTTREALFDFRK